MTSQSASNWEHRLLALAQEAMISPYLAQSVLPEKDNRLAAAYHACTTLTRAHSRTFFLASALLPQPKRRAMRALYAFCRTCDNLIDVPEVRENAVESLLEWRNQVLCPTPAADPIAAAYADTSARYGIPWVYAEQLIGGVRQDAGQVRYATFDELAGYCYSVASTVGLMAMHIIGFEDDRALAYAVKLGVALQLTNILRDVGEDWQTGRVYLPQDELARFELSDAYIAAGRVNDAWRALMRFQIARARQLYDEALPGIALLARDGRFAVTAAAQLYRGILADIEAHDYDVFQRRAYISGLGKVSRLPAIWSLSRRLVAPL
ncbi:MAG: squalene/phytoene synthase family protein [Caldilineales bacterium]